MHSFLPAFLLFSLASSLASASAATVPNPNGVDSVDVTPVFTKEFLASLGDVDIQANLAEKLSSLGTMESLWNMTGDVAAPVNTVKTWMSEAVFPTAVAALFVYGLFTFFNFVFGLFGTVLSSKGALLTSALSMLNPSNSALLTKFLPDGSGAKEVMGNMMDRIAKNLDRPALSEILTLANQVYEALEKYEELQPMFQE